MGERLPKLERDDITRLRTLAATGQFLFHGSSTHITTLEPRQAVSQGKLDGEPAVCAASDPDTAIYMALMDSAKRAVLARGESCRSGYTRDGRTDRFYATQNIVDAIQDATGYVHVLSRDGFSPYYGEEEMRSPNPVSPQEVIEVYSDDFRFPIESIES